MWAQAAGVEYPLPCRIAPGAVWPADVRQRGDARALTVVTGLACAGVGADYRVGTITPWQAMHGACARQAATALRM
ncbi:hypothetical protein XaplCFBP3122_17105 [Xanthomonas arboricola pv. populi]|uniref:Uncharacterized protein n=1 Tax=Xanthomonas arboricola pv. populi TaxID=487823 RepID=A0A2S6Z183_9XANT|nr:hypothetical protein XaplCFBP3122_17105 [Xanthomonas arboricola pv. populi]